MHHELHLNISPHNWFTKHAHQVWRHWDRNAKKSCKNCFSENEKMHIKKVKKTKKNSTYHMVLTEISHQYYVSL